DQPQGAGQVAHLRGEHRADQRAGAGDGGEVVAEQHVLVGRHEVQPVVAQHRRRGARGVKPQHPVGDEQPVVAVRDHVDGNGGHPGPQRIDRLAAAQGDSAQAERAQQRQRCPGNLRKSLHESSPAGVRLGSSCFPGGSTARPPPTAETLVLPGWRRIPPRMLPRRVQSQRERLNSRYSTRHTTPSAAASAGYAQRGASSGMCAKFIPYQLVTSVGAASSAAQAPSRFTVSPWARVTSDRLTLSAVPSMSRRVSMVSLMRTTWSCTSRRYSRTSSGTSWPCPAWLRTSCSSTSSNGDTATRMLVRSRLRSYRRTTTARR